MNNVATIENKSLSIWESETDLAQIKEIYGKDLSVGEFKTLVQMGKATGLNPFLREIWAVKYGNSPAQIFIGRDGYRKSAQRSPFYDYHVADAVYSKDEFGVLDGEIKHRYNLIDRGDLIGAYCIVKRKNSSRSSYVFVELKEYSTGQSLWKDPSNKGKPATMIKKVAEAQGLRAGFQELFAGTYSEYEQWDHIETNNNKQPRGINGLKETLGMVKEPKINENTDITDINPDTGEIIKQETKPDIENIKFLMETAPDLKELLEVAKQAKLLPEQERVQIRMLYKEREKALSQAIL